MKKSFKYYLGYWIILVALFNILSFVGVGYFESGNYSELFWFGYIFITLVFFGQLYIAYIAFKPNNLQKTFYNISLIVSSYVGLMVSIVVGTAFMIIPELPIQIGIIVCAIVVAFNAIELIKARSAGQIVGELDDKIKNQTFFIKSLAVDAESLINRTENDTNKKIAVKVFEAIKYSDPMSNDQLSDIENKIATKFNEYAVDVLENDIEKTTKTSSELINLIGDRNRKCRLLK